MSAGPPVQFLVRAVAIVVGLALLLVVDVRGAGFYVAWALIVAAFLSEALATLVLAPLARRPPTALTGGAGRPGTTRWS